MHTRFTSLPFDQAAFYVSADVSWFERTAVIASIALISAVGLRFVARTFRGLAAGVRQGRDHAISVLAALVLLVASQGIDLYRDAFKVTFRETTRITLSCYEESFELGAAACLLLALWQMKPGRHEALE